MQNAQREAFGRGGWWRGVVISLSVQEQLQAVVCPHLTVGKPKPEKPFRNTYDCQKFTVLQCCTLVHRALDSPWQTGLSRGSFRSCPCWIQLHRGLPIPLKFIQIYGILCEVSFSQNINICTWIQWLASFVLHETGLPPLARRPSSGTQCSRWLCWNIPIK